MILILILDPGYHIWISHNLVAPAAHYRRRRVIVVTVLPIDCYIIIFLADEERAVNINVICDAPSKQPERILRRGNHLEQDFQI
jgi:hypothetical protein